MLLNVLHTIKGQICIKIIDYIKEVVAAPVVSAVGLQAPALEFQVWHFEHSHHDLLETDGSDKEHGLNIHVHMAEG